MDYILPDKLFVNGVTLPTTAETDTSCTIEAAVNVNSLDGYQVKRVTISVKTREMAVLENVLWVFENKQKALEKDTTVLEVPEESSSDEVAALVRESSLRALAVYDMQGIALAEEETCNVSSVALMAITTN